MMDALENLAGVCLRLGECSPVAAKIHAAGLPVGCPASLRGPFRVGSSTLPADYGFRPLSGEPDSPVISVVLEPCFWRPDAPFWYELHVGGWVRPYAIGPLGVRDGALLLGGEPWRLRGVFASPPLESQFPAWRTAELTPLVPPKSLSEETLSQAVRGGLSLGVDLRGASWEGDLDACWRLACDWPCLVAAANADEFCLLTPRGPQSIASETSRVDCDPGADLEVYATAAETLERTSPIAVLVSPR